MALDAFLLLRLLDRSSSSGSDRRRSDSLLSGRFGGDVPAAGVEDGVAVVDFAGGLAHSADPPHWEGVTESIEGGVVVFRCNSGGGGSGS